jgi:AbrB family looped-hinge helix DNA binding protein
MTKKFETTMSSKGQVVISKEIRKELGLKPKQKFLEERRGNKIILKPVMPLSTAGGFLKGIDKRPTRIIIKEVKKGWK